MRMTLEGLQQDSVYYVQLRVKYRDRPGDWSRRFELVTLKDQIKPGPVTDLAGVYNEGNLTISWARPAANEDGSALEDLRDYVVTIHPTPEDIEWRPFVIYAEGTRAVFTKEANIAAFGRYRPGLRIVVQARDIVGNLGNPVEIIKTKPRPKKVSNLTWTVEGTDFVARWQRPTENEDGSAFTDPDGYEVKVIYTSAPTAEYPQGQQNVHVVSPHYTEEYRFTRAENEAAFSGPVMPGPDDLANPRARGTLSLEVRARDSVGQVSDSDTLVANNPVPEAVTWEDGNPIPAMVNGINHITANWKPNKATDGVAYYEVWLADNASAVGAFRGRTAGTSYIIDTVQYGATQYVYLIAVDIFGGRSPKSEVKTGSPNNPFTVDTVPPAVPTGYSASTSTTIEGRSTELPAAVLVSWAPSSDTTVAGYHISYSPVVIPRVWEYKDVFVPDATSSIVSPLNERTEYVFRVRTYDRSINPSEWSPEFQGISTESASDFVLSDISSDIAVITGGSLRSGDFSEPVTELPEGRGWRLMPSGLDIFNGRVNARVISAGELRSNVLTDTESAEPGQPLWSLNLGGNLTVRHALVKGSLIVGSPGLENGNIQVASYNYGAATGNQWGMLGNGNFHLRSDGPAGSGRLQINPGGVFGFDVNNVQRFALTNTGTFSLQTTNGGLVFDDEGIRLYSGGVLTVDLHRSGYALFAGEIEADAGLIAGWVINDNSLYRESALIRSDLGLFQVGTEGSAVAMRAGVGLWAGGVDPATLRAPFQVSVGGYLRAVYGEIGGFSIDSDRGLISGLNSGTVGMRPGWGFWTGSNNFDAAPLRLFHSGELVAYKAFVQGEIQATRFRSNNSMAGTGNWVEIGNTGVQDLVDELRFFTNYGGNVASMRGHTALPGSMVITAQNSPYWFAQDTLYTEGKGVWTNGGYVNAGNGAVTGGIGRFQNGVEAGIYYDNSRGYYMRPYGGSGIEIGGYGQAVIISSGGASYKTFVIDHPTKPDNYLVHAAVEGPTADVFYRGTDRLEPDGGRVNNGFSRVARKLITLPEYFENLSELEGRTVQVTPICEVCDLCGQFLAPSMAASPVRDGQFWVYALAGYVHDHAKFYWEVKAVRKDSTQFEVEPKKSEYVLNGNGPYTYLTKMAPDAKIDVEV